MKTVVSYSLIIFLTLLFLVIVKVFNISYPLEITNKTTSGELSVVGEGKVDVVPDSATVDAGITVSNALAVEEVRGKIDTVHNALVDALTRLGIKKEDIKTSNYSINPNYNYETTQKISGYNGSATVTVKVRDISKLPDVIVDATKAGANQVSKETYSVDSPEKYREKARNIAIANAKDQAQKLSQSLGIKLGKITNIVESAPNNPPIYSTRALSVSSEALKADFQPGSETITSTVTLYFEKQ